MGGSDDFDEYADAYYSDEVIESDEVGAAPRSAKRLIAMGLGGILLVGGIAFGAKATINSGNGFEFGQGFRQNIQCVTNSGGSSGATAITVTPYAGFVNISGGGKFTLDSIYLEGIPSTCNTKYFTIRVFTDSGQSALVVGETSTAGSNYTTVDSFKFLYTDSSTVSASTLAFIDVETATDVTADTTGSLQITFDADQIQNFADAGQVYKITVETSGS